ncbi:XRE family transcriptional regulator [Pseudomonas putida]|uniref:XRE family transcriptional regulator n=1 Tax=Pseudomonas putida TaxID=303 RepID=A0A1X0ZS85_PSEPU|nr:XRE family transcriptional regulator [Pseudomonas putida]
MELFLNSQPLPFTHHHCKPARALLGWSVDALAFRSRVSPAAIRRVEEGAELRRVTMQALSYAMELEGLVFFPGHSPMRADNCRGATPDPRTREDYHLLE